MSVSSDYYFLDKRKKRNTADNRVDESFADDVILIRKDSVVGVYFESGETPLPAIGIPDDPGTYTVCIYQGSKSVSSPINCTSLIQTNLLVHAEAQVGKHQ